MEEEKKEVKKAQAYTLSPRNIAWLAQQALKRSTPEKRVSASALLDGIVEEARLKDESNSRTVKKNHDTIRSLAA